MTSPAATATDSSTDRAETAAALRLVIGRLSRRMRQESADGHSLTQMGILATLDRQGATTLGDLAAVERVAPPTITKAVNSLVDDGLIEKVNDPDDRRVCHARLSTAGRRHLQRLRRQRDAWLANRLATIAPEDVERLVDLIPLLQALGSDEADPARSDR